MTSMSSTGFGQYPGDPGVGGGYEQRTSVLAILSLVCSLICFIPGLAVLGAVFGIISLIAIARSEDRLMGRGLAISGLIISLIVLAIHVGLSLGAVGVWKVAKSNLIQPATSMMAAVESGDNANVRIILTPEQAKKVSDSDIDAFRQDYQADLGKFVSIPNTPMELWDGYKQVEHLLQTGGGNDAIPVPAKFENGMGLLIFQVIQGKSNIISPSTNVMVVAPNGHKWTLYDPQRGVAPSASPQKPDGQPDKPDNAGDAKPGDSATPPTTPTTPTTPKEPEPVPEPKPGPG